MLRRHELRDHAGAAQVGAGAGQYVGQVQQLRAERQVVDVTDKRMFGQVCRSADRWVVVQIVLGRVQLQSVVAQFAADVRSMLRTLQGDDDVGLALGQADEVRQRQDVHRDRRVGVDEVAQLRRDEKAAEAFGAAHAHMTGQRHAGPGNLLARHVQGTFDRLGIPHQPLAFGGQDKAAGPGFLEQQCAQRRFQGTDAPRHRGVVHRQALGRGAGLAGAGDFKEKLEVIPVQRTEGGDVFLHVGPVFMCVLIRSLHIYTPKTAR
ncbi:hypothetical protein D9M71_471720 [compost metagenome]